ncbi:hypothetical protein HK098_008325 [Nowakowskiella sp. JEL0407]|nr:hypothetical protein HK098_008325 [Nowakowskiella sp. JEL0407]
MKVHELVNTDENKNSSTAISDEKPSGPIDHTENWGYGCRTIFHPRPPQFPQYDSIFPSNSEAGRSFHGVLPSEFHYSPHYRPDFHEAYSESQIKYSESNTYPNQYNYPQYFATLDQYPQQHHPAYLMSQPKPVLYPPAPPNPQYQQQQQQLQVREPQSQVMYSGSTSESSYGETLLPNDSGSTSSASVYSDSAENKSRRGSAIRKKKIAPPAEKIFKCTHPGCNEGFTRRQNLKSHMGRHTGVRDFACSEAGCESTFRRHQELLRHVRSVHAPKELRPFSCPIGCGKKFARADALKRHLESAKSRLGGCAIIAASNKKKIEEGEQ